MNLQCFARSMRWGMLVLGLVLLSGQGCPRMPGESYGEPSNPGDEGSPGLSDPDPDTPSGSEESNLLAYSGFDADSEGWLVTNNLETIVPTFKPNAGHPGGCIQVKDVITSYKPFYWDAPAAFLGNQEAAYGGTLSFAVQASVVDNGTLRQDFPLVRLTGAGYVVVYPLEYLPIVQTWSTYTLNLDTTAGWLDEATGSAAGEDEIRQVLRSLVQIMILGDYSGGANEIGLLDEVRLTAGLVSVGTRELGPVLYSWDFEDESDGGWTVSNNYSATIPTLERLHGRPSACLAIVDQVTSVQQLYWEVPPEALGDWSDAFGGTLSFDVFVTEKDKMVINRGNPLVRLVSQGTRLVVAIPYLPQYGWTSYSVPLDYWVAWIDESTGSAATEAQLLAVLSRLDQVQLLGDYSGAAGDTCRLDNVVVRGPTPIQP